MTEFKEPSLFQQLCDVILWPGICCVRICKFWIWIWCLPMKLSTDFLAWISDWLLGEEEVEIEQKVNSRGHKAIHKRYHGNKHHKSTHAQLKRRIRKSNHSVDPLPPPNESSIHDYNDEYITNHKKHSQRRWDYKRPELNELEMKYQNSIAAQTRTSNLSTLTNCPDFQLTGEENQSDALLNDALEYTNQSNSDSVIVSLCWFASFLVLCFGILFHYKCSIYFVQEYAINSAVECTCILVLLLLVGARKDFPQNLYALLCTAFFAGIILGIIACQSPATVR